MSSGPYTGASCDLLKSLRSASKLKLDAFAAYVKEATHRPVSDEMVRRWVVGLDHFPADLVPVLAAFLDDEADKLRVLRAYAAPAGMRVGAERGEAGDPEAEAMDVADPLGALMQHFLGNLRGGLTPEKRGAMLPDARRLAKELGEWIEAEDARQATLPMRRTG